MMLVTLQQASDHLRRDTTDDDTDLTLKVHAASAAVLNYLGAGATFLDSSGAVQTDSNGDPVDVPFEVQAATLLLVGEFYKNREGEQGGEIEPSHGYGYLPRPVVALLYPLRDPALS